MSKDPFQILADEITLIRSEIEKLQRTSLDKDEAKALHGIVVKSVADLQKVLPTLERSIERQLFTSMEAVREEAVKAAREAAERAVVQSHARSIEEAGKLSRAAGEARREAWRYFGGFWVWIASVGSLGVVLGALGLFFLQGRADAVQFGAHTGIFCGSADGRKFTANDGKEYCGVPID